MAVLLAAIVICGSSVVGAFASTAEFNPDTIRYCVYLNDTKQVVGLGHAALLLIDSNGTGRYYSFQNGTAQIPIGKGDLTKKTLSANEVPELFATGIIPNYAEDTRGYQYDRIIKFEVLPEEGRAMYTYAEHTSFPYYVFSAGLIPIGEQCDTIVQKAMAAGNAKYKFFTIGLPRISFYFVQCRLEKSGVAYTEYYPI